MKNYFQYLQNVLGIRSVLLPLEESREDGSAAGAEHRKLKQLQAKKLVVLDSGGWNKDEKDLLGKMISALSKETKNLETVSFSGDLLAILPSLVEAQEILLFDENLQKTLTDHGISHSILIPSPKNLIANPDLKRDAWDAMKKAALRVN